MGSILWRTAWNIMQASVVVLMRKLLMVGCCIIVKMIELEGETGVNEYEGDDRFI